MVVSPLIALMKDQVRQMTQRGVSAVYVGEADYTTETAICDGKFQLVCMSPEALLTNLTWRDMLLSPVYYSNLVALIVDEAHCVKKWCVYNTNTFVDYSYTGMCAIYAYLNYRGETFRKEFAKLGDVRSLIPESVRVMALTATATKSTRRAVIKQLKTIQPKIVSVSPNKPNIKYSVLMNTHSLEETFAPLIEEIRQKRKSMDRTIIFCRTYDQCARIYMFIVDRLGKEVTEPIGICPDLASFTCLQHVHILL